MSRHDAWSRARLPHSNPRTLYVRALWFALAGLVVAVMLRGGVQAVSDGYRTSAAVLQLEEELADVQREHDALQDRLAFLATPEGKRLEAVYQFKLVRPGEHLLTVRQDDETRETMSTFDPGPARSEQPAEVVKRYIHSPSKRPSGE